MGPTPTIAFNTRQAMLRAFPFSGHMAELGVFQGDFASDILNLCPFIKHLDLVDAWGLFSQVVCSGDQDGNNVVSYNSDDLENSVRRRFKSDRRVDIHKTTTRDYLQNLADGSLDAVYIDADHSYEGCLSDLELAYQKVRPGGWIAGHDYEILPNKCKHHHEFGVGRAVDEFMMRHEIPRFTARANDGCVSFLIKRV